MVSRKRLIRARARGPGKFSPALQGLWAGSKGRVTHFPLFRRPILQPSCCQQESSGEKEAQKTEIIVPEKKNMNKTSGVCRLPWVQVDMQKQGSFPSLNPWAHLQNICQVQIYQTGCRIWLARVHLADICLSSLQSISQFSQQLYYTVIVFLLVSSLDSQVFGSRDLIFNFLIQYVQ